MSKYGFIGKAKKETPQNKPVPFRKMIQNNAGGYVFEADTWLFLNRCLILGTSKNSYYQTKFQLTEEFVNVVLAAAKQDAKRTAQAIVEASDGKSFNNSAPLLALALLSTSENFEAKTEFRNIFLKVVRTASHFYEWMQYSDQVRGRGRLVKDMRKLFFTERQPEAVAYQLLKYNQRFGFSARDALRLARVKPETDVLSQVNNYFVKGWDKLPDFPEAKPLQQIWWYEKFKTLPAADKISNVEQSVELECIANGGLTQEMATKIRPISGRSWKQLAKQMPIGALIRHLGALTSREVISANDTKFVDEIETKLTNPEYMRKARIHPIDVMKALKIYKQGGAGGKSDNRFSPVPRVVDILSDMVEKSFNYLEPTGLRYGVFLDVSGSMTVPATGAEMFSCVEIGAILTMSIVKAEKNYRAFAFSDSVREMNFAKNIGFMNGVEMINRIPSGGTNVSLVYQTLLEHNVDVDVVVCFTDNESWIGRIHPFQALEQYRKKVGHPVRVVYCTLQTNKAVLTAPEDKDALDICGAHSDIPRMIQEFAQGKF